MNTFQDLRQKLLELYKEALELYPTEEIKTIEDLSKLDEIDDNSIEEYMVKEIRGMNDDIRHDFLSLLALYYFMYVRNSQDEEDEDEDEEEISEEDEEDDELTDEIDSEEKSLYETILDEDKNLEDVIDALESEDNTYLYDAVSLLIDEELDTIDPISLNSGRIESFEEYEVIEEELMENDIEAKRIYREYHPNLKEEEKNYIEYTRNIEYAEKLSGMSANSLADFIEKITVAKQLFSKKRYLDIFLFDMLTNTRSENTDLYNKIYLLIVKYYYIKGMIINKNDKEKQEKIKLTALSAVSSIPDIKHEVTSSFLDFDLYGMMRGYYVLPKNLRKDVDKTATLEYRKTYGNEGKWDKYKESDKEKIFKYYYNWYNSIENAQAKNETIYVYYTVNENDCYTIPRLCVIVNDNDEIVDILGRRDKSNVEPEMLRTLDTFSRRFTNVDDIKIDIELLKRLKTIEEKIDKDEELSKQEIEYLFEIECEIPYRLLFHVDLYSKNIQAKTNLKKMFAKYFDCSEEEVAERQEELNDKTKVALFDLDIIEKDFPYPNLIAVYGTIYAYNMTKSKSLKNIKYVRYTITAPELKEKNYIQEDLLDRVVIGEASKTKRK